MKKAEELLEECYGYEQDDWGRLCESPLDFVIPICRLVEALKEVDEMSTNIQDAPDFSDYEKIKSGIINVLADTMQLLVSHKSFITSCIERTETEE